MKRLNLGFRFILEMLALVALFLFGLSLSDDLPVQLVLAICLPLLAMIVWGLFVAPKASRRLDDPARLAVELVVWFAGVLAFGFAISVILAILFGLAVLISLVLMFYWGQRGA
ncbi:MAG: YrdB family protein [Chloroflexota bacterium]